MIRGLLVLEVPNRQGRYRLGVRTRGSQPRDRGSNPRTGTILHRSPLDNSPAHRAGLFLCTIRLTCCSASSSLRWLCCCAAAAPIAHSRRVAGVVGGVWCRCADRRGRRNRLPGRGNARAGVIRAATAARVRRHQRAGRHRHQPVAFRAPARQVSHHRPGLDRHHAVRVAATPSCRNGSSRRRRSARWCSVSRSRTPSAISSRAWQSRLRSRSASGTG